MQVCKYDKINLFPTICLITKKNFFLNIEILEKGFRNSKIISELSLGISELWSALFVPSKLL